MARFVVVTSLLYFAALLGKPSATLAQVSILNFTPVFAQTGETVIIRGAGFGSVTQVTFGGVPAASFQIVNANEIRAVLAGGATGDVAVNSPSGTTSLPGFTFGRTPIPEPRIFSIDPAFGGFGTVVTITGSGFTNVSNVNFGTSAMSFTIDSDTQIRGIVSFPPPVGVGAFGRNSGLTVSSPINVSSPGGNATSIQAFVFIPGPAPRLSSLTPNRAEASGDTLLLEVNGANFTSDTYCLMQRNGETIAILPTRFRSPSLLNVIVPPSLRSAGTTRLELRNTDEQFTSATLTLTPASAPRISALVVPGTTASATTASGRAFTMELRGSGFFSNASMSARSLTPVLNIELANLSPRVVSITPTRAIVEIPGRLNNQLSNLLLRLTNADGQSTEATLTVTPATQPYITSVRFDADATALIASTTATSPDSTFRVYTISGVGFDLQAGIAIAGVPLQTLSRSSTDIQVLISEALWQHIFFDVVVIEINNPDGGFAGIRVILESIDLEPLIRGARHGGQYTGQEEVAERTPRRVQTRATQQMLVYPNPSADRLHLEFTSPNGIAAASATIRVLTVDGAEVLSTSTACTPSGGRTTLDVQHLARGMYLVEITVHGKRMVSRFVKQ